MIIAKTPRLTLRYFTTKDTDFIIELLNDRAFIENINDKGVRTKQDALNYIESSLISSYKINGYGLYLVLNNVTNEPMGMCGLLKRDELTHVDLGYAFLPQFCRQGFAQEAANMVLEDAKNNYLISTVSAVTFPPNTASNNLLVKLGFILKSKVSLYEQMNNYYEVCLD